MEKVHYPKMFRSHPFWFIAMLLLCPLGIGLIVMFVWWINCKAERLIIGSESVELQKGILSKYQNEVFYSDVRNIQIRQSLCDRIFNVGHIGISSSGQDGIEIEIGGISDPDAIRDFIYANR